MSDFYNKGLEGFANKEFDWDTDNAVAILMKSTYTSNVTHSQYVHVSASSAATASVTGKAITTDGVCDADDTTFSSVNSTAGDCTAIVIVHGGSATSNRLICLLDGFTVTPNGNDITASWAATGSDAIFHL